MCAGKCTAARANLLETKRGISVLNWKDTGKFLWRPDFRPRLNEWVADFALPGQAALDGPDWASRMVLFRLYYLGLAPYENARHFLGLSEPSWVNWTEQIRQRCGKELLSRTMFPPAKILYQRLMKRGQRNSICKTGHGYFCAIEFEDWGLAGWTA